MKKTDSCFSSTSYVYPNNINPRNYNYADIKNMPPRSQMDMNQPIPQIINESESKSLHDSFMRGTFPKNNNQNLILKNSHNACSKVQNQIPNMELYESRARIIHSPMLPSNPAEMMKLNPSYLTNLMMTIPGLGGFSSMNNIQERQQAGNSRIEDIFNTNMNNMANFYALLANQENFYIPNRHMIDNTFQQNNLDCTFTMQYDMDNINYGRAYSFDINHFSAQDLNNSAILYSKNEVFQKPDNQDLNSSHNYGLLNQSHLQRAGSYPLISSSLPRNERNTEPVLQNPELNDEISNNWIERELPKAKNSKSNLIPKQRNELHPQGLMDVNANDQETNLTKLNDNDKLGVNRTSKTSNNNIEINNSNIINNAERKHAFDDIPVGGKATKKFEELLEENLKKNSSVANGFYHPGKPKNKSLESKREFLKKGARQYLSNAQQKLLKKNIPDSKVNSNLTSTNNLSLLTTQNTQSSAVEDPFNSLKDPLKNIQLTSAISNTVASYTEQDQSFGNQIKGIIGPNKKFLAKGCGRGGGKGNGSILSNSNSPNNANIARNNLDYDNLKTCNILKPHGRSSSNNKITKNIEKKDSAMKEDEYFKKNNHSDNHDDKSLLEGKNFHLNASKANCDPDISQENLGKFESSNGLQEKGQNMDSFDNNQQNNSNFDIINTESPKDNLLFIASNTAKSDFNDDLSNVKSPQNRNETSGDEKETRDQTIDERFERLNSEITKVKLENEMILKKMEKHDVLVKLFNEEKLNWQKQKEKEMQELEQLKKDEMRKIVKDKKNLGDQGKGQQNIKYPEDYELLKKQLSKSIEDAKITEKKNQIYIEKLKRQIYELTHKNEEMQRELRYYAKLKIEGKLTINQNKNKFAKTKMINTCKSTSNIQFDLTDSQKTKNENEISKRIELNKVMASEDDDEIDQNETQDNDFDDRSKENENYLANINNSLYSKEKEINRSVHEHSKSKTQNKNILSNPNKNLSHDQNSKTIDQTKPAQIKLSSHMFKKPDHEFAAESKTKNLQNTKEIKVNNDKLLHTTINTNENGSKINQLENVNKNNTDQTNNNAYSYNSHPRYIQYLQSNGQQNELISQNQTQDGKLQKFFANGKKEIIFNNGVRREVYPDGYIIVHFKNDDIKQTLPDNTMIYYFAETQTTQTTLTNGQNIYRFSNNQIEFHYPDGAKEIHFCDGTKKIMSASGEEETIFTDGTIQRINNDNIKTIDYANKQRDVIYPNGIKIRTYPDGKSKKYHLNGHIEEL